MLFRYGVINKLIEWNLEKRCLFNRTDWKRNKRTTLTHESDLHYPPFP
jgi:hypothetical protein